ncbi:hypothetical protein [Lyngbya confervoides]|uniref:Uncharacterized protein n=1 Tax=Lyngbya confervoides BDU141951 TaxID=1574623 RepID=A0ABD4SY67_9CYAN|nr:hypothetical protein [Lyngbya confervoides]MCM1981253.1 hypothetical protein [Lyngbya confervoides BDU141951]
MSLNLSSLDQSFQLLRQVRARLLKLHKALLDSETARYEEKFGAIGSKGKLLELVMGDPWFHWLRDISQFIVQIDEAFSPRVPFTLEQSQQLLQETERLLTVSETGTQRQQKFYAAIQRDPDVATLYGELLHLLNQ